ncbi:MAG: hypothetical protein M1571_04265 [Firmicutes bacterium]|nr:hypothetical protein [Bacillota bacterium]
MGKPPPCSMNVKIDASALGAAAQKPGNYPPSTVEYDEARSGTMDSNHNGKGRAR